MAYRRNQGGLSRSSTFKEEIRRPADHDHDITTASSSSTAPSSPLARRTNANSPSHAARLDSFLSSRAFHSSFKDRSKGSATYDYTSMRSTNEPGGFWGVLARKAKSILDDRQQSSSPTGSPKPEKPVTPTFSTSNHQVQHHQYDSYSKKFDSPTSRNGVDRSLITSPSLNQIGDTIGNALEEASKKCEDHMIQETSAGKWRKSAWDDDEEKAFAESNQETTQLKATRHVAIATADKAKQLLRELKSVKADLAVAKERCCQLEEENKILREKGADHPTSPTDDDLIRDQLETLLAEKGVLAHENSVYARENRYLREIVEFHHLSMQDHMLMYLDQDDDNDLLSSFNHHDNNIIINQTHHVDPPSLIN